MTNNENCDDFKDISTKKCGPDFLCVGMQKAATRWLYDQLCAHEEVWMPPVKELHFFDKAFNFKMANRYCGLFLQGCSKGKSYNHRDAYFFNNALFTAYARKQKRIHKKYLLSRREMGNNIQSPLPIYEPTDSAFRWYKNFFKKMDDRVTGEITPAYCFLDPKLIERIGYEFPDIKIILLVRNPVNRAWSQFRMKVRKGGADKKILTDPKMLIEKLKTEKNFSFRSFPTEIYKRWAGVIRSECLGVFSFDDICTNPKSTISNICEFLEINSKSSAISIKAGFDKKSNVPKQKMPDDVRFVLGKYFKEEIKACKKLFGGPTHNW